MKHTEQANMWSGDFGHQYTDRNPQTPGEMDALYQRNFGVSRSRLNKDFLGDLDRTLKILEVGANVGTQLHLVQKMGFQNLYGLELQMYAIKKADQLTRDINLIQGNAFDIPFEDNFFDLVFTSGVLIHISPNNILRALKEIHRCSTAYIWGFEYFSEDYTAVHYRNQDNLMWKTNFMKIYLDTFPDLELIKAKKIPYLENQNVDSMFLLKKTEPAVV